MEHLKSIYRKFDIRGAYPDELFEDEVYKIARSLATIYGNESVVIGHDYRPSSESLYKSLSDGFLKQGASVTSLGMVTTPMLYFAAGYLKAHVAVMITGSHILDWVIFWIILNCSASFSLCLFNIFLLINIICQ